MGAVDLEKVISTSIRMLVRAFEARKIRVSSRLEPEKLWVHGNQAQLMQAVIDVGVNALQVSSDAGEVEIFGRADGHEVEVHFVASGVADSYSKPEGPSLGLTLTQTIIQAHHGTLDVRNEGRAKRVVFRLPASEPPGSSGEVARSVTGGSGGRIM
jgi:signal transduction histidine kinase